MKKNGPEYFAVIFPRLRCVRPPRAVFRIFARGEWVEDTPGLYHVKMDGATAQSLKAEIEALLESDESVSVSDGPKFLLSAGLQEPVTWESLAQPHSEKKLRRKNSRALKRILSRKRQKSL